MDAMTLATMILDPKKVTTELLNKWVQEVDYYCLMDVLMTAICTSPIAIERMEEWTKSDDEWIGRAGWSLLANIAIKIKRYKMISSLISEEIKRKYIMKK